MKKQTVWITGASGGIGRALSNEYNKKGYFVILSGRNQKSLESVQNELPDSNSSSIYNFDVNNFEEAKSVTQDIIREYSCPNVIILNAGISQRSMAIDTEFSVTESILKTNFLSNINIVNPIISNIQDKKSHLVIISSVTGKLGTPMRSSYAASKHALHGYFDSLRAEMFHSGAKVTIVCPGYVSTNISINALTGDGSTQNSMDQDTEKGLNPNFLAKKIYNAQQKGKFEIYVGRKEIIAIYLKRFLPTLLHRIIRNIKPK